MWEPYLTGLEERFPRASLGDRVHQQRSLSGVSEEIVHVEIIIPAEFVVGLG